MFLIFFPLEDHLLEAIALSCTGQGWSLMRELTVFYFLFFRAAQENAERLFPDNVECKTLHSLAYEKVGSRLVHKG